MIRLVPTTGYSSNTSLGRLRFQSRFARNLFSRAVSGGSPNLIVGVDPPQPIGTVSVRLARHHQARLILDVMDRWPELFSLALPRIARPLGKLIFAPHYRARARNLSAADAVTALAETYLEVALRAAPDVRDKPHLTVFSGIDVGGFRKNAQHPCPPLPLPPKAPGGVWAVYAGTLGENYDVDGLMNAALHLRTRGSPVSILVAGTGPRLGDLLAHINHHSLGNLIYLGVLSHDVLSHLYARCDIGLSPYGVLSNVAIPDKLSDYLAAGLPIVNSLKGELEAFLRRTDAGVQYRAGDGSDLANKLDELANDPAGLRRMGERSWALGEEFDARVQFRGFVDLANRLVDDDPK